MSSKVVRVKPGTARNARHQWRKPERRLSPTAERRKLDKLAHTLRQRREELPRVILR